MKGLPMVGLGLLALLAAPRADAVFHLMSIVEVFPGTSGNPNAQFIELQMYASGQNLVSGHPVTVFNADGVVVGTSVFSANVPNGANQARILIATTQAQAAFGISADLTMLPSLPLAGGKVCFDTIDCFSWGNYAGPSSDTGTPFAAGTGLTLGQSANRRLTLAGGPGTLEAADDTNNSANDFLSGAPSAANNSGAIVLAAPIPRASGPALAGLLLALGWFVVGRTRRKQVS